MRCLSNALIATACLGLAMAARADDVPGTAHAAPTCVDVAVNGHPVLAYDCLNQQLAAGAAAHPAANAAMPDPVAGLPSNQQVGQFNFSAFSNRMGSNLGKSAFPQRPPPPPVPTRVVIPVPGH